MKTRILILFLLIGKNGFTQIPNIDPTAIQRLIELKNTVATLKKGLALQKILIPTQWATKPIQRLS